MGAEHSHSGALREPEAGLTMTWMGPEGRAGKVEAGETIAPGTPQEETSTSSPPWSGSVLACLSDAAVCVHRGQIWVVQEDGVRDQSIASHSRVAGAAGYVNISPISVYNYFDATLFLPSFSTSTNPPSAVRTRPRSLVAAPPPPRHAAPSPTRGRVLRDMHGHALLSAR